jgi:hypothetical protein
MLIILYNQVWYYFQPIPVDRRIQFPRVLVTKVEIVVVEKEKPSRPVSMTIEIWGCYEVESSK